MKTIKQMADELGVSKQTVYRFIKSNCINEAHQDHITKYYSEAVETLVKSHFNQKTASSEVLQTASHDAVVDTVIEMLQRELEVKNQQIEHLNRQLQDVTAALVVAQQNAATAQALHAGTIQGHLTTDQEIRPEGFFSRLFNRKK